VAEIRVAATAADAARSTPGVAHLQPGFWGLVQQLGSELWTRVTGQPRPDTAGSEVRIDGDTPAIDVTLVADGRRPAAAVAGDVQRNVYLAVRATHDIAPRRVAVHVVAIALPS
jgi:hypothetical protein